MSQEVVTQDGEIIPATDPGGRDIDIAASVSLARAEIDMQVATARAYPRSVAKAVTKIVELCTLDEETAESCCYALIRSKKGQRDHDAENKPIEGPSIRLAEIAISAWGNCRTDTRVIAVNRQEKWIEAVGVFHDLETNVATRSTVRRRISTRTGNLFSEDMIIVTGNAACSIAKRNAILAGIPRGVYGQGYRAAREIIAGTLQTLGENRAKVYKAFASFGVTPAQIHEHLNVGGEADVGLDHIAQLRAAFSAIKNGEATVQEMFSPQVPQGIKPVQDPLGKPPEVVQRTIAHDPETGEIKEPAHVDTQEGSSGSGPGVEKAPAEVGQAPVLEKAQASGAPAGEWVNPTGHTTEPSSPAQPAEKGATDNPEAAGSAPGQQPPEAAAAPPEPTDEESYKAHVFWWVGHEVKSREEASKRWKSEMQLRIKLQVPGETVEACKRLIESAFPKEQSTHG